MNKRTEHISIGRRQEIEVHRMGDPSAPALFYTHGLPSSGEESVVVASAADNGFQVVAPTCPGFGNSTINTLKNLQQVTEDSLFLLDKLRLREVYTVGTSAGAKHVLSLLHREPDRVTGTTILSGLPPFEDTQAQQNLPLGIRLGLSTAKILPQFANGFFVWLAGVKTRSARKNPEHEIRNYIKILPPADQQVLSEPEMFHRFVKIVRDWSKPGTGHGMFQGIQLAANPWGIGLESLKKKVTIFHGALDPIVPLAAAKSFQKIPDHTLQVLPEGGHGIYAYPQIAQSIISDMQQVLK